MRACSDSTDPLALLKARGSPILAQSVQLGVESFAHRIMQLWPQNALYAAAVFGMGVVGCGLPLVLTRHSSSLAARNEVLSLGGMFSAGVFVAAGFVHLLGDAAQSLDDDNGFPWAMLICSSGLLISLYIEFTLSSIYGLMAPTPTQARSPGKPGQPELEITPDPELGVRPHIVQSSASAEPRASPNTEGSLEPRTSQASLVAARRRSSAFDSGMLDTLAGLREERSSLTAAVAFLALSFHR